MAATNLVAHPDGNDQSKSKIDYGEALVRQTLPEPPEPPTVEPASSDQQQDAQPANT